ncbi:hypothetical protein Rsub_00969 [Raphidocelis subcapitata]|uniref:CUE domain-containing protein n=1 Tax=Raphidocelis subcapitata TaxID=307507 RepID=A0A2V0NTK7_9CHLO|nr:hypothetical protein Rsub_00969 [Raphidocelis subcapitata]|eukprot:GBF88257.1 hypothetical protein Rsub_00969 [Raphidocelis subcapitata]
MSGQDGLTRRGSRNPPGFGLWAATGWPTSPDGASHAAAPHSEQRDLLHLSSTFPEASTDVILEAYEAADRNVWRAEQALQARFEEARRGSGSGGGCGKSGYEAGRNSSSSNCSSSSVLDELLRECSNSLSAQAASWFTLLGQKVAATAIAALPDTNDTAPANDRATPVQTSVIRAATIGAGAAPVARTRSAPRGAGVGPAAHLWPDAMPAGGVCGKEAWAPPAPAGKKD